MAALTATAPPSPAEAAALYEQAVRAVFSRWTLLRLALDQGWSDGDGPALADQMVAHVLRLVAPSRRTPPDATEIEDALFDALEDSFNAQAEDGSVVRRCGILGARRGETR
eukprot:CAMPEP_0119263866 /NCGR_PEP_ID=MMETSP1329-20130426/3146_1 /TAXON_ID=114041 /ORGANISM="Genus nov. species nov., Strain RCC1024" /LENGTH=110 /DNA_ID=CAMNT_0007263605 /DNA_START=151 /DNA_END=480 /DNA_ORIENTATION=+